MPPNREPSTHPTRRTPTPTQWLGMAVLCGLLVLMLGIIALPMAMAGRILPGVRIAEVAVGGLSVADAAAKLAASDDVRAPTTLRAGDAAWELPAGALGVDVERTVAAAYAVGRSGSRASRAAAILGTLARPVRAAYIVRFDRQAAERALAAVAADYDVPARDASIVVDGTTIRATEPADGRRVDAAEAVERLDAAARIGAWPVAEVALRTEVVAPVVRDAHAAYEEARSLLSGPVELVVDESSWTMVPAELGSALRGATVGGRAALAFEEATLAALLRPVTEVVSRTAEGPRFHFNDDARRLQVITPAVTGRQINVARTGERILEVARGGSRRVAIAYDATRPPIDETVSAEDLGIRELIHEETSHYRGSSADRVHNIAVAAARFDGVLIPPDATFSFNLQIGDITEETGYRKTLIILDGATADGVGGGVCQVSTTLFRTAFWAGLPIVARTAHGYRVGYYEQNAPVGLDATVYHPVLDFRFANDTGQWLLIESYTNRAAMTVTFKVYGTKPNREVTMEGPRIGAQVPPPPPRVEVDPSMPPGRSEEIELARYGASVSVTRVITAPGKEPLRETFSSAYRPTGELTKVGPSAAAPAEGADDAQAALPADAAPRP